MDGWGPPRQVSHKVAGGAGVMRISRWCRSGQHGVGFFKLYFLLQKPKKEAEEWLEQKRR